VACPCRREDNGGPGGGWEGLVRAPAVPSGAIFHTGDAGRSRSPSARRRVVERRLTCREVYEGRMLGLQGGREDSQEC